MLPVLILTTPIKVYRTTGAGYLDENDNSVTGESEVDANVIIQPYRDGESTFTLESGMQTSYAIVVHSDIPLFPADDQDGGRVADEVEYKGKRYFCSELADWTGYGLTLVENYTGLFYRKDKL